MRPLIRVLSLLLVVTLTGCAQQQAPPQTGTGGFVQVYFSPKGGATDAVVRALNGARKTVRVQAYSFTSKPIAQALLEAKKRGVDVEIVVDKSQRSERYTEADFTANQGIPTFVDDRHAIAHNKIMLIDGETILTGSFNFTKAGEESNAENLLVIRGYPDLMRQYEQNYAFHKGHSDPYRGKGEQAMGGEDEPSPRKQARRKK
ncbi:MAG: phospholipase D family protein [Candidatus Latescibacteria bacterium]|nr:phospholipase D family protein [Candidatus Latescibacterota bacterium]